VFLPKYPSVLRKNKGISVRLAIFFTLLISVILLTGCDNDGRVVDRNELEYFPLKKGWYQVYDVEEIVFELGVPETLYYQLRTTVIDSFENGDGTYTYAIERVKRSQGEDTWIPDETWSARLSEREAVLNVGSTPYVVLRFPARSGVSWDGNAYNDEINPNTNTNLDIYSVASNGSPCEVNGKSFEDCVTVLQEDNEEFLTYHDERREIYARNAGLIFKETVQLYYCNDVDRNCVGQQLVDAGVIYRQMISEYGLD
jgi:hypothetical protein